MIQKILTVKKIASVYCNRAIRNYRQKKFRNITRYYPDIIRLSVPGKQTFFGYYDFCPFSTDNARVLAMVLPAGDQVSPVDTDILIGYFDIEKPDIFHSVGWSETWCWQQGCRLHWFPKDEQNMIHYNRMVGHQYGSVIQNITSGEIMRQYLTPFYDLDHRGEYALTLNFSRLNRLRPGYGYGRIEDMSRSVLCPNNDGIWILDLKTGEKNLILSLMSLARVEHEDSMKGAAHYVNHLSFNPDSSRFMVFHLWVNRKRRYSRVFTSDLNGDDVCLLTRNSRVSHYDWRSPSELLLCEHKHKTGMQYILYTDQTSENTIIGKDLLIKDGHPTYSPDRQLILTDTYPDKFGEQNLLIYSEKTGLMKIGSFFSPLKFRGEKRCDLHPRWDRKQHYICIDTAQDGHRAIYIINTDGIINVPSTSRNGPI